MQCTHDCRRRRGYQQYDLVTAAYVLSELSSDAERRQTVQDLWDATKGILVIVEPGTPSGYQNVIAARGQVKLCWRSDSRPDTWLPPLVLPSSVAVFWVILLEHMCLISCSSCEQKREVWRAGFCVLCRCWRAA